MRKAAAVMPSRPKKQSQRQVVDAAAPAREKPQRVMHPHHTKGFQYFRGALVRRR